MDLHFRPLKEKRPRAAAIHEIHEGMVVQPQVSLGSSTPAHRPSPVKTLVPHSPYLRVPLFQFFFSPFRRMCNKGWIPLHILLLQL